MIKALSLAIAINKNKMKDIGRKIQTLIDTQIADCDNFYFQKAKTALEEWNIFNIGTSLLDELIQLDYSQFLAKAETNEKIEIIRNLIFTLVAYCDAKACGKQDFNQYEDKRAIAQSGIRQNAWVRQWLKYKRNHTEITDAIKNLVNYISDPEHNYPILSEKHRELICRYFLEIKYNKDNFSTDLSNYFNEYQIPCKNRQNCTQLYTRIIYSLSNEWKEKIEIEGLIARDSTDWKEALLSGIQDSGYGIIWKDCLPTLSSKVIPLLTQLLEEKGSFYFYFVSKNKTKYKARIIDFSTPENYSTVKEEWKDKSPFWFCENFGDYNSENQYAKIAFLTDSFEEIKDCDALDISCFKTIGQASIKNPVAYTKIITKSQKQMSNFINQTKELLLHKKNIILQGAPGTGKTYNTAAIALSIIKTNGVDFSNHEDVMKKYKEYVDNGQIGFVTFHQSMDYEDFVEGLKPEIVESGINYKVENGIFKQMCKRARTKDNIDIINYIDKYLNEIKGYNNKKEIPTLSGKSKLYVWWNEGNNTISTRSIYSKSERDPEYSPSPLNIEKVKLQAVGDGTENNWQQYAEAFINAVKTEYNLEIQESNKPFVLIIDEINRGNVSKILGELITLLEPDKRTGGDHPISVTLPYSKEKFDVPSNLYIIATMNTTDRSVGTVDYAVRRRFAFVTLKSNKTAIDSFYEANQDLKHKAIQLFNAIEIFLKNSKPDMDIEDLMVGHSYFMSKTADELKMKLEYEIIPLIKEYYKDGIINITTDKLDETIKEWKALI